jgi:hypothetical protein
MAAHVYRVYNEKESPPGGWKWHHPKSGRIFTRESFSDILEAVQRTLLNLGQDPSLAALQIHQATAESLLARGHHDLVQITKEVPREPAQYASGAKAAFLKWWRESPVYGLIHGKASRGEAVFVDQAEGDRRAAICAKCPHNVIPAGKGWLQNWTDGQMLKSVEGRETASQDKLGVCEVCSCELRAAVWWQPDIIATTTRDAKFARDFPGHCWKRQIISNPTAG